MLLLHFAEAYRLRSSPLLLGKDVLGSILYHGVYGVTVFFVVSGYLITSMSLARWGGLDKLDVRTFYLYRFARIAPSLLLALVIIVPLGCLGLPYFSNTDSGFHLPASYFLIAVASILTFWHNVLLDSVGWFNYCLNVYWSLSVEEVFYLALPLACLALKRNGPFLMLCAALIVCGPVYRSHHANDETAFQGAYLACFDAIAFGCVTALIAPQWRLSGTPAKALRLLASLAFAIVYLLGVNGHQVFGFSLVALCTSAYLIGSVNDDGPSAARAGLLRPVRWLGQHSYELYLFHIVVLALMRNAVDRRELPPVAWALWLTLFLMLSAAAAYSVARYVSGPANTAIRRRFEISQRRPGSGRLPGPLVPPGTSP